MKKVYVSDGKIFVQDDEWITTQTGAHIKLDENGTVTGGAGGNLNGTKITKFKGRPKQWGGTVVSVKKTNAETIKKREKESQEAYKKDKEKEKRNPIMASLGGGAEVWKQKRDKEISKSKKGLEAGKKMLEKYRAKKS